MEIELRVNGKIEKINKCTIATMVAKKGLTANSLVVEHNGRIVKQDEWGEVTLQPGDVLELLNFVGGG